MLDANAPADLSPIANEAIERVLNPKKDIRHEAVAISDVHMPRRDSNSKKLYHFLLHNPSDVLLILGDFLEGYENELKSLSEWDKRVLDLIHARIERDGMRVIYIPGNHDQYLRRSEILNHSVMGMDYTPNLILNGWGERKTLFFHGDELDKPKLKKYDNMIYRLSKKLAVPGIVNVVDAYSYTQNIRNHLHDAFCQATGVEPEDKKFRRLSAFAAEENGCDSVVTGHKHAPKPLHSIDDSSALFGNTGGWVGNLLTAMILPRGGDWQLVDWNMERFAHGLVDLPNKRDENPFAAFRDQTEEFIEVHRDLHRLWRANVLVRHIDKAIDKLSRTRDKLVSEGVATEDKLKAFFKSLAAAPLPVYENTVMRTETPILRARGPVLTREVA